MTKEELQQLINSNIKNIDDSMWHEDIRIKFKDRRVWEDLYNRFFAGLARRFGQTELIKWRYELGLNGFNPEYDEYYYKDGLDYTDVYGFVYRGIKKAIPGAVVGYTGAVDIFNTEASAAVLRRLSDIGCKPDFVSFSLFVCVTSSLRRLV